MDKQNDTKLMLFGLWEKKDRNGNTYFTGTLNGFPLKVFRNTKQNSEKSPDFFAFLCDKPNGEDKKL